MKILYRLISCSFLILQLTAATYSQQHVGIGLNLKNDIYQRFSNPKDDLAYGASGSFLLNLGLGPKIWVGGENFSVSAEGTAMLSPLSLGVKDFKGLGAVSFPIMAKLNFQGLSALNREGKFGFSIGGGIQWSRTELFGIKNSFEEIGVERKLFKTYIGEIAYGFGMSGFTLHAFIRYGHNSDLKANTINFGLGYDFNFPTLKELTNPEF